MRYLGGDCRCVSHGALSCKLDQDCYHYFYLHNCRTETYARCRQDKERAHQWTVVVQIGGAANMPMLSSAEDMCPS